MVLKGLIINNMKKTKTDDPKPETNKSTASFAYRIATLWGIMLTIGVVILAVKGYEVKKVSNKLEETVKNLEASNQAFMNEIQNIVQKNSNLVDKLDLQNSEIRVDVAEIKNQRVAIDALYGKLIKSKLIWTLGEVEHALVIAEQQLSLLGSVPTALKTLVKIREVIELSDLPELQNILVLVQKDITRLEAMPDYDWSAISKELGLIVQKIQSLPLAVPSGQKENRDDEGSSIHTGENQESLWTELWKNIKNLVKIDTLNPDGQFIFNKEQEYVLKENIKMRLLSVRLAIMIKNERVFGNELKIATDLIDDFLDLESPEVVKVRNFLETLTSHSINSQQPSIQATIDVVRRSY